MQWKAGVLLLLAALAPAPALAAREAAGDSDLQHVVEQMAGCMGDRRMVLLGEAHGTREIPLLVAGLAERGSRKGPLLLALEIHGSEHRPLVDYLDGDGSEAARERLRKRPYWARPRERNDGRRSEDMLDLVERMRQLRAQGRDVAILPFDVGDGDGRDQAMADHVRKAWEALPRGRMLVLAGNVHAMRGRPGYAPPGMQEPMGAFLQDLAPVSIDITASTGAFWACPAAACGPQPVTSGAPVGVHGGDEAFDCRVVLPRFTVARLIGQP